VGLSQTFGTFLTVEKSFAPAGVRIPDRPARGSVAVQNINIMISLTSNPAYPFL